MFQCYFNTSIHCWLWTHSHVHTITMMSACLCLYFFCSHLSDSQCMLLSILLIIIYNFRKCYWKHEFISDLISAWIVTYSYIGNRHTDGTAPTNKIQQHQPFAIKIIIHSIIHSLPFDGACASKSRPQCFHSNKRDSNTELLVLMKSSE